MAAVMLPMQDIPSRLPTPPSTNALSLNTNIPSQIPNKHIPYCSPGPQPERTLISPPPSPPTSQPSPVEATSLLYPATLHPKLSPNSPAYTITAATLERALNHIASQPLPDSSLVFPWAHGLHPENHFQNTFFDTRRQASRRVPKCLRGLTIVKAGGDLTRSKLKGAIAPGELLETMKNGDQTPCFIDIDPKIGFHVRNFHIQACKMATVSDIVVYGDEVTPRSEVEHLATLISKAQKTWSKRSDVSSSDESRFNTFVLVDSFEMILKQYPHLVAIDGKAILNPEVIDFCRQERLEMCALSSASEFTRNVWLGPSPDPNMVESLPSAMKDRKFDILVETVDFVPLPDTKTFTTIEQFLHSKRGKSVTGQLQFPSSGSIVLDTESPSKNEHAIDSLLQTCRWIHRLANPSSTSSTPARRFFIHCPDGYTETTLLALAYLMFSERLSLSAAFLRLHVDRNRNFFAYPADKDTLERFQVLLAAALPGYAHPLSAQPNWMQQMDGSLPSRVLKYLYLGNLPHASNPGLLRHLGITRVLSVGEPIAWPRAVLTSPTAAAAAGAASESPAYWHEKNFLYIEKVQDNGQDPLAAEIERCLAFIEEGRARGEKTLVHCRVGVSRSATICIAEVMRERGEGFAGAYCFVRARRLNVIIQPHLRFVYELLKWEEVLAKRRGVPLKREFEWAEVAREIAAMNRPYCR